MKRISFYPWFLSTLIYSIGMYFGFQEWKIYFIKVMIQAESITSFQTKYFIVLSVACLLATYNFINYSKRYFKGITKRKRR